MGFRGSDFSQSTLQISHLNSLDWSLNRFSSGGLASAPALSLSQFLADSSWEQLLRNKLAQELPPQAPFLESWIQVVGLQVVFLPSTLASLSSKHPHGCLTGTSNLYPLNSWYLPTPTCSSGCSSCFSVVTPFFPVAWDETFYTPRSLTQQLGCKAV